MQLNNPEYQKIHSHARWNRQEDVIALLRSGCPIDLQDATKNTALIVAAQNGHLDLAQYLVGAGDGPCSACKLKRDWSVFS